MAQLTVRIDSAMAQRFYDIAVQEMAEERELIYDEMITELKRAALAHTFMRTGTILHDDGHVTLFEHPTKGDEASMMAYDKKSCRFFVGCEYMPEEATNMDEIYEAVEDLVTQDGF